MVLGWLDTFDADKGPQGREDLEQTLAEARDLAVPAVATFLQDRSQFFAQRPHAPTQLRARAAAAKQVPHFEDAIQHGQAAVADVFGFAAPFNQLLKVSLCSMAKATLAGISMI
jgi:hypothetical protein